MNRGFSRINGSAVVVPRLGSLLVVEPESRVDAVNPGNIYSAGDFFRTEVLVILVKFVNKSKTA